MVLRNASVAVTGNDRDPVKILQVEEVGVARDDEIGTERAAQLCDKRRGDKD
jgi:hypothetical protein